jgi:E3 ubiquitin-protein ligase SspH2
MNTTIIIEKPRGIIDLQMFEEFYRRNHAFKFSEIHIMIREFETVNFPDSFAFLQNDVSFTFWNCNITTFHESLFTSSHLTLNFAGCPLSINAIRSLIDNIDRVPIDRRPRIEYDIVDHEYNDDQIPLDEVIPLIFKRIDRPLLDPSIFKRIKCDSYIHPWLNRIYKENTKIVEELLPHIIDMVIEMTNNEEFMDEACNIIQDATATCGDRMILSILYVSMQYKMHLIANHLDRIEDIFRFLIRGPYIMDELEKIARDKIKSMFAVDEVEVYLAYPIKLRDVFNIPIETKDMLYYTCSSVNEIDLKKAQDIINKKLKDKDYIIEFLIRQPLWNKVVDSVNPDIFDDPITLTDQLLEETRKIITSRNLISED